MLLKARTDIHLARRLWHLTGVGVILVLYYVVPPAHAGLTSLLFALPVVVGDVARFYIPRLNHTLIWLFRPFMRESERSRIAGITFMLIGVTLIMMIFPRKVVYLSLMFLGLADPMASFIGIRYGRDRLVGNKSVQGSLAAFLTCFVISGLYFYFNHLMTERLPIVCLLSGLIGAVSELMPVGKLDDNFVFPVLSSLLLTGMFYLFGGL